MPGRLFKHSKSILLGSLLLISSTSCQPDGAASPYILDIPAIAHKSPQEVIDLLGKPDSTYSLPRHGNKVLVHLYQPHQIEIYYPQGRVSEIQVNDPAGLPYNEDALSYFNIKPKAPNRGMDKASIRWTNIPDFSYIHFYASSMEGDSVTRFKMYYNLKK